jgi:aryl-alcohol dehydrogenase-like predicted oxidoreductase
MSGTYGPADETESVATIHAALDAGVTLLDTADFYGMGHNELLIGQALRDRDRDRDRAAISVKFGARELRPAARSLGYRTHRSQASVSVGRSACGTGVCDAAGAK